MVNLLRAENGGPSLLYSIPVKLVPAFTRKREGGERESRVHERLVDARLRPGA
jgi:hypothetical protein